MLYFTILDIVYKSLIESYNCLMDDNKLKKYLGIKIRNYRNKLGYTQEVLSEKIGINQRQVSLIEKGKSFPKSETLVKMVNIFGCNTKDLFDFEPIENVENLKEKLESLINELPEEKLKVLYIVGKNI